MGGWRGWGLVIDRRVVVNLHGGSAVEGVLVRQSGPLVFLKGARLLEPGREPVTMDGEVVIERERIDFTQAL